MAWAALQLSDVQARISAAEYATITQANTNSGTMVAALMLSTVNLIRGYVGNVSALDQEGTIPDKLVDCACDIFRYKFLTSIPGKMVNEDRRQAYRDAISLLRDVAAGKYRIEEPVNQSTEQPFVPMPVIVPSWKNPLRPKLGWGGGGGPGYGGDGVYNEDGRW